MAFFLYIDGKQYLCFVLKITETIHFFILFFYRDELIKCLAQPTHILIASNMCDSNQVIVKKTTKKKTTRAT